MDTSLVDGDSYVSERRDEYRRGMKLQYQLNSWLAVITGAVGVAYMTWGARWMLVGLILAVGFLILRAIEIAKQEQLFILGSLENRARLLEARSEGVYAMVRRMDEASRKSRV